MKPPREPALKGDGKADDTLALTKLIRKSRQVSLPPGDYRITSPIAVPSGTTITGAGRDSTRIFDDGEPHSFFIGTDQSGIEISHLTIEGVHPGGPGSNTIHDAINFFGNVATQSGFSIHDCRIRNMSGRGVVFVRHCSDVWVYNNIIENCSIGVFLFGGVCQGQGYNNIIRHCRIGGIYIDDATNRGEPDKDAFRPFYHTVQGNQVRDCGYDPVQTGFGIGVSASYGVSILGNIIDKIGDPGVIASPGIIVNSGQDDLFSMQAVNVANNVVTECSGAGIFMEAAEGFSVVGNTLIDNNLWITNDPTSSEIIVRPHTLTKAKPVGGIVAVNLIRKTGMQLTRTDVGVNIIGYHQIHVGDNAVQNIERSYSSAPAARE